MKYFTFISLLLILISCEEKTEWELKTGEGPVLIVEAMITNHPGLNYVKLSQPVDSINMNAEPVSNARVLITDGEKSILFTENSDTKGTYLPEPGMKAVVNREYALIIRYNEETFTAGARMIPVSPLEEFKFHEDNSEKGMYVIEPLNNDQPSMISYEVDFSDGFSSTGNNKMFYHYNLSSVNVNEFFKPNAEKLVFPYNSRVVRTKYSLSGGYEQYIRSLLSETEWKGGWFDILPGNLPTNLSNGAVGYFAACTVVQDTVYIR